MYLETETMHFFQKISVPRKVGSEGHFKVRALIKENFAKIHGLSLKTQAFDINSIYMERILNGLHPTLAIIAFLSLLFLFTGLNHLALIFAILTFIGAIFNRQILLFLQFRVQNIGKKIQAENVIGIIEPTTEIKQNLVFVGHYDSISHRIKPILESIGYFAGFIGITLFSTNMIIVSVIQLSGTNSLNLFNLIWGIPIIILTFIGIFNQKKNESKGVLDNASGVAQMYDLAKKISKNPLKHTAVYFLCSDAEEMGDYGAYYFVKDNEFGLLSENTHFIVVDSIGAKSDNIVVNSISLPKRYFDPELESYLKISIEETKAPLKFQWIPPLLQVATDHIPIDLFNYRFLLVACSSFVFHGYEDNWDAFDQTNFDKICECLENLTRKFDA